MQAGSEGNSERWRPGMDDVTKTVETVDEEEPQAPAAPRPGDEKAYEDSWYQVLRARTAPAKDESEA